MRILKKTEISLNEAVILSSIVSPRQLVRVNLDEYALILYGQKTPLWGFQSKLFSRLLDAIGETITDIEVYTVMSEVDSDSEISEFRMVLESGRCISINVDGNFHEVSPLIFAGIENPGAVAVDERWHLEAVFPWDRMMVTQSFASCLDFTTGDALISDILNRIWFDYSKLETYCGQQTLEHQPFSCEFGELVAVELQCGRVVFYSPDFEGADDECF